MRNYIGLIHKQAASDFGVSFPDFPGVVTAGRSLDDARAMAEEALAFHIEGMVADGEAIRDPSRLEEVMADPQNKGGVVMLVGVKTDTRKAVRVNVTFTEDTLEQIDEFAEAHGYTRSDFWRGPPRTQWNSLNGRQRGVRHLVVKRWASCVCRPLGQQNLGERCGLPHRARQQATGHGAESFEDEPTGRRVDHGLSRGRGAGAAAEQGRGAAAGRQAGRRGPLMVTGR
jgi:predicted RNase H-like HicB family nuclease